MPKTITLFLSSSPYSHEDARSCARIAEAALDKGHAVNLVASGDGVYAFLTRQKARGVMNAEEEFGRLMRKGLKVSL